MSNDERAETQRLREANAVLMEAVEHYADKTRWRVTPCDSLLHGRYGHRCGGKEQTYNHVRAHGYAVAQAAIEKAKGILQ